MNVARLKLFVLPFALWLVTIAATPNPMTPVRQFVDGFNTGNAKMMAAVCDRSAAIVDDFPPNQWASCSEWYRSFVAFSKQDGDTAPFVKMGAPLHVDVTGNVAYVVVPTTYRFKHRGALVVQNGSTWTLVLKNTPAGWRITAWAWADGK